MTTPYNVISPVQSFSEMPISERAFKYFFEINTLASLSFIGNHSSHSTPNPYHIAQISSNKIYSHLSSNATKLPRAEPSISPLLPKILFRSRHATQMGRCIRNLRLGIWS